VPEAKPYPSSGSLPRIIWGTRVLLSTLKSKTDRDFGVINAPLVEPLIPIPTEPSVPKLVKGCPIYSIDSS
jgi:hypothetical protein